MTGWAALLTTLAYQCALFALAYYGDARRIGGRGGAWQTSVYALSLAVYCSGWTFFGSVGIASVSGWLFLSIYLGPLAMMTFGRPLIARIAGLSKSHNITSVADFVAARYGKAENLGFCVAMICLIGAVPYIALQLKAITAALNLVLGHMDAGGWREHGRDFDASLLVALVLAGFAIAFGARRVDATEHQDGLMLAISAESVIKLIAFLTVGATITWGAFGGLSDLYARVEGSERLRAIFKAPVEGSTFLTMTILSAFAIILLPRQFHVMIVENRDDRDIKAASWVFSIYLIAINLFVVPLAIAGLIILPDDALDADMTVLALPLHAQHYGLALFAMIGGVSAATAMIVVECVALSITASNNIFLPLYLRGRGYFGVRGPGFLGARILIVRRLAILGVLAMGYAYLRVTAHVSLVSIGLISFACIGQIAPAFFGGLWWRGGTAFGALCGLITGAALWAYTLFLPSVAKLWAPLADIAENGPYGLTWLKPTALFNLDLPPFTHGALISISINCMVFVGVSLWRKPSRIEQTQAVNFVSQQAEKSPGASRLWRSYVTTGELEATLSRYLGVERARSSFDSFYASRGVMRVRSAEADVHTLRFAEKLLASAIGAASSRLVLSLILKRRAVSHKAALRLVDEASAAIQYNRDLLQYALDFARQGITVFDHDRRLICWNREYRDLFDLPQNFLRVGVELEEIVRFNAQRGLYGAGEAEEIVARRIALIVNERQPTRVRLEPSNRVIEIRSAGMPAGGFVTTYLDMTAQVEAEEALAATNETLEHRVRARTLELVRLNRELERARARAEEANLSKTRFLAAASHDILQPLNAARLYATSLAELAFADEKSQTLGALSRNVDAALESVEEILTTLLDISRLDAGAMKAEFAPLRLGEIFAQLAIEFAPAAKSKGLRLAFVRTSLIVRSDRRLLRRVLQNFISNAIKYTPHGRVLVGARRLENGRARIEVWDTGIGIAEESKIEVFREFARLEPAQRSAPGVGLGLSIVERIGRVLDVKIDICSRLGAGSVFSFTLPLIDCEKESEASLPRSQHIGPQSSLTGLVVVVIDNDPRIIDGLEIMLRNWGCRTIAAGSIAQMLHNLKMEPNPPDVIIADYHLDHEDGFSAIAAARAKYDHPIPAVLSSADRTEAIRSQAADNQVRVLSKPLKPAALRALLSQWRSLR